MSIFRGLLRKATARLLGYPVAVVVAVIHLSRGVQAQGSTGLIPVSSQNSISAGYKSLPYPRQAYSFVQLSSIFSISQ